MCSTGIGWIERASHCDTTIKTNATISDLQLTGMLHEAFAPVSRPRNTIFMNPSRPPSPCLFLTLRAFALFPPSHPHTPPSQFLKPPSSLPERSSQCSLTSFPTASLPASSFRRLRARLRLQIERVSE